MSVLSSFHACSHASFVVFGHYPRNRGTWSYKFLGVTDFLAHAQAAAWGDGGAPSALMGAWHLWKSVHPESRSNKLINLLDAVVHARAGPLDNTGVLLYALFRVLDLVW